MHLRNHTTETSTDIVLIGGGIMSATLGTLLNELQPGIKIEIFERLDKVAAESSAAWNNAGTGHSAFCELNYTPLQGDKVDISKALHITESFEISKQLWSYLIQQKFIQSPNSFINSIPHMSFVWGDDNVAYLKKRYDAMRAHHFYKDIQYADDYEQLAEWIPLIMEGRDKSEKVAATRIEIGTDVNFGTLTNNLFDHLKTQEGVTLHLNHEVHDLHQDNDGYWHLHIEDIKGKQKKSVKAKFVFIGAGGGALPLLEKSHIPEGKGYGGFPVGGQWLSCENRSIIERHHAKVYGKAGVGTPPMSVPHLDSRVINGKRELLFGPYAGFSTKFLKKGSWLDLPLSIRVNNIRPMVLAGIHNIPLTKYLIEQVRMTPEERFKDLQDFFPEARMEDWELKIAGQRVQVIKKDEKEGGILEFGTEIVSSADCSIAALLGASPGASTSVA
ncbi:MAG TPA: malate dehydrogenase (quinone), partial [Flavipsychrobacter sp.]|nr:malate dehydrogenase (quinone) [Flavipsychrobacter sp.]